MEVQKLRTEIQLGCSKKEAISKSPAYHFPKILVVRYSGQVIFTERNPLSESIDLAQAVRMYSPLNFSYMLEQPTEKQDGYIKVGKENYYVSELKDRTYIAVESFHSEANEHYEKVENVKDLLIDLGIPVIDGVCEITMTKKC